MKIVVVYVIPPQAGVQYQDWALRFIQSYNQNPPGLDHETLVVVNGCPVNSELKCWFASFPNCRLVPHDNSGYDIGAFQFAAHTTPCDMMVFFGTSTYFIRPGWLWRMADAFNRHGNAQYGAMGNRGDIKVKVWPHIRTTAFWMKPELMAAYPFKVSRPEQRHPFEHGQNCFTEWITKQGINSWVITWGRDYEWKNWDDDPNGYHRGDQSALLAGDRMTERPYYPRM